MFFRIRGGQVEREGIEPQSRDILEETLPKPDCEYNIRKLLLRTTVRSSTSEKIYQMGQKW